MEKELTQEQIEVFADPKRSAVSLIYDVNGNVIGNSQHLARTLLKLAKAIDQFTQDLDTATDKLSNALESE